MTNSPHHGKRISRAGSVDTLSPCESIASDDLILDYEQSDASSYDEQQHRLVSCLNIFFMSTHLSHTYVCIGYFIIIHIFSLSSLLLVA